MGRPPYGTRTTCESSTQIDVRRWHREGRRASSFVSRWSALAHCFIELIGARLRPAGRPLVLRQISWNKANFTCELKE
jgi:hypothetical protein